MSKATAKTTETLTFDADALTFDDLTDFEDATGGGNLAEVLEAGTSSARAIKALYWIMRRQTDPAFTLEQAGKAPIVALNALSEAIGGDDEQEEAPSS